MHKFYNQKKFKNMKKAIALFLVAGMFTFVACGPSAKEKEAKEKARLDSIRQDSIAKARVADSIAKAEREAFVKDSIAKREAFVKDSLAAAAKKPATKKATTTTTKPATTVVKAGQGKRS